jgi:Ubiquitin carboxyl-terminal hydrolase
MSGLSVSKGDAPDFIVMPDLIEDRNERIKHIVGQVLMSLTFVGTFSLVIAACVTPLSGVIIGVSVTALVITFIASVYLIKVQDSEDFAFPSPPGSSGLKTSDDDLAIDDNLSVDDHYRALKSALGSQLGQFLLHFEHFESIIQSKISDCFSSRISKAVQHGLALKKILGEAWVQGVIAAAAHESSSSSSKASVAAPLPDDPKMASKEEIAKHFKGLTNPGCNCFMNASIQALFQDADIATHMMNQLAFILSDDFEDSNPATRFIEKYSIDTKLKSDDQLAQRVRLQSAKDSELAKIIDSKDYKEHTARLESYELDKIDISTDKKRRQVFMSMTLKEAAKVAQTLLTKWQAGGDLSSNEAKIFRLSLMKLMNRPSQIVLKEVETKEGPKPVSACNVPGVNFDLSINYAVQEESNEFARALIDGLDEITGRPNPLRMRVSVVRQAYRAPKEGEEHFVEAIDGATKAHSDLHTTISVTPDEGVYKLDDLSLFSAYRLAKREGVKYEKESETLPTLAVGATVDEKISYTVDLPSKLKFWIQAGDRIKNPHINIRFTNSDDLTITLPKDASAETLAEHGIAATKTYELTSFTVHYGLQVNSGHYYTYTRKKRDNGESYWIKQNDSSVTAVNIHEMKRLLEGKYSFTSPNMLIFSEKTA